jgi:hypothetical protein
MTSLVVAVTGAQVQAPKARPEVAKVRAPKARPVVAKVGGPMASEDPFPQKVLAGLRPQAELAQAGAPKAWADMAKVMAAEGPKAWVEAAKEADPCFHSVWNRPAGHVAPTASPNTT